MFISILNINVTHFFKKAKIPEKSMENILHYRGVEAGELQVRGLDSATGPVVAQ